MTTKKAPAKNAKKIARTNGKNGAKAPAPFKLTYSTMFNPPELMHEKYEKEVPSRIIGESIMQRLAKVDQIAYVRFASVYKSFRDIDEFMSEMTQLVRARSPE